MTRILVQIPEDMETPNPLSRTEFCAELQAALRSELEDELDVSDAFIVEFSDGDAENYLIGLLEPDQLLAEVRNWNQRIITGFADAVDGIDKRVREHGLTWHDAIIRNSELNVLQLDSPETYELRKCAGAIDGHFMTFYDYMNYLPNDCGYPYARTLLLDRELADIEANPAEYAIMSVYIK